MPQPPTIRIIQGDALSLTGFDALVIPANKQLTLGWGSHIAEKVLRQAGRAVEQEALRSAPGGLNLGDATITSAGALAPYQRLIHAATLDKWDLNPLFLLKLRERTSAETLCAATTRALQLAESAQLESVVFTPMGAGIGGMRDDRCAQLMLDVVRAHRAETLQRVAFACLKTKTAEAFEQALAALDHPGQEAS